MRLVVKILIVSLFCFVSPAEAQVKVAKSIDYGSSGLVGNQLNVYYPKAKKDLDVLIFIHGGSWFEGRKEIYWWLGRNFARKDVVSVIINYPLAPQAKFREMGQACAMAVKWVYDHIDQYGGNKDRIFVMGHSAGGHLAELINADPQYFKGLNMTNPIKGVVLNDAFGLDMDEYLTVADRDDRYREFLMTFTEDREQWKLGSPISYVNQVKNPHLLLYGDRTYEAIQLQTQRFYKLLSDQKVAVQEKVLKRKSHVPMIRQMVFGCNRTYGQILAFFQSTKN